MFSPTSRVGLYHTGKPIKSVVYCLNRSWACEVALSWEKMSQTYAFFAKLVRPFCCPFSRGFTATTSFLACEQALLFVRAKRATRLLSCASRASTVHNIPQMENLLEGYLVPRVPLGPQGRVGEDPGTKIGFSMGVKPCL